MKKEMSSVRTPCKVNLNLNLTFFTAGSTSAPGNAAPQVIEALRKAGVKELPDTPELNTKSELDFVDKDQPCVTEESSKAPANSILKAPKMQESDGLSCLSGDSSNEGKEPKPSSPRKSVTFAKGTKLADANYSKPKQATSRRALKTINEIKRRAGLADIHSIKPNTPSKDKSKKHSSIEKANRIGHDVSGQLVQEREDDADHDSPRNDNEDTPTTLSKRTISTAATPCYPSSQPASQDEDVSLEHVSNDTAADRDADSEPPIIPADESPEDATLRLQMLEYSMNEVGAVVAEIELDEDDENDSDASYTDEEDEATSDASSAEEDEDDFGRTKRRVLDDVYLEEMRALEKKLNATAIHNVGPQGSTAVPITTGNLNGTMAIEDPLQDVSTLHTIRSVPKGARFAEELDVQTAPPMGQKIDTIKPLPRPVKDTIIKRTTPASVFTEPKAELKKRTSRFKSARTAGLTSSQSNTENVKPVAERVMERTTPGTSSPRQPTSTPNQLPNPATSPTENRTRITPSGPPNRPHNPTVIERPYSGKADLSTALEPDEFDPTLIHQQVVTEYHQMRNRIIQRQGGFLTTDKEKEEVPLTEEEGGAPKVSIFKAARLARLG